MVGTSPAVAAAPIPYPTFADPAFQRVWERYDRPVYSGEAARSFTWGAQISGGIRRELPTDALDSLVSMLTTGN